MVREFTREDERAFSGLRSHIFSARKREAAARRRDRFERAVTLCAGIAWHFFEHKTHNCNSAAPAWKLPGPAEQTYSPSSAI